MAEVKKWVADTTTIYHLGVVRLGTLQVILGVTCVSVGAVLFVINDAKVWAGLGVWSGLPMLLAGFSCLFSWNSKPRRRFSHQPAFCFISAISSLFLLVTSATNIAFSELDAQPMADSTFGKTQSTLIIINTILMVLAAVGVVAGLWTAEVFLGVCRCSKQDGDNVFIIPCRPQVTDIANDMEITLI